MAVLAIAVSIAAAGRAESDPPPPTITSTVRLQLQISGLTKDGSTLKIVPGHPGCQFTPIERRINLSGGRDGGMTRLEPILLQASTTSADRDCSFAITLTEPGQAARTYRRGVRLTSSPAGATATPQTVKVYLSAPSLAARDTTVPRR
jgi:hypothetical protein